MSFIQKFNLFLLVVAVVFITATVVFQYRINSLFRSVLESLLESRNPVQICVSSQGGPCLVPLSSITVPIPITVKSSSQVNVGGDYVITEQDKHEFANFLPFEARTNKDLRNALIVWATALPDSRAKAVYLAVLREYYDNDAMLEQEQKAAELAKQEAAQAPRPRCLQDAGVDEALFFVCKTGGPK